METPLEKAQAIKRGDKLGTYCVDRMCFYACHKDTDCPIRKEEQATK